MCVESTLGESCLSATALTSSGMDVCNSGSIHATKHHWRQCASGQCCCLRFDDVQQSFPPPAT